MSAHRAIGSVSGARHLERRLNELRGLGLSHSEALAYIDDEAAADDLPTLRTIGGKPALSTAALPITRS